MADQYLQLMVTPGVAGAQAIFRFSHGNGRMVAARMARYTAAEVEEAVLPLRYRIAELEAQLKNKK